MEPPGKPEQFNSRKAPGRTPPTRPEPCEQTARKHRPTPTGGVPAGPRPHWGSRPAPGPRNAAASSDRTLGQSRVCIGVTTVGHRPRRRDGVRAASRARRCCAAHVFTGALCRRALGTRRTRAPRLRRRHRSSAQRLVARARAHRQKAPVGLIPGTATGPCNCADDDSPGSCFQAVALAPGRRGQSPGAINARGKVSTGAAEAQGRREP